MSALCRTAIPLHRLFQVLLNAGAEFQTSSQLCLRPGITQPRGRLVPFHRFDITLLHALALPVSLCQQELCPGKSLFRALAEALQSLGKVLFHSDAVCITIPQICQRRHILPGCSLGVQNHGLLRISLHAHTSLKTPAQVGQALNIPHG